MEYDLTLPYHLFEGPISKFDYINTCILTHIKVLFPNVLAYDNVYARTSNYNESEIVHILACILED